jgi:putative ABC transport system substrate-binding protein
MIRTSKWIFLIVIVFLFVSIFSLEVRAEKRIGILMFSDEQRYTDAAKGMTDKLTEEGFGKPGTTFIIEMAGANKAKAAELVREFASAKMDLIFTLGTSITIPVSREIKDVPIVFSVIYDPVESGIAKDFKSSGNNTTGVSSKVPMSELIDRLKEFTPIKRLAVLYSPGEKNSELALRDLQAIQSDYQIRIIPVPLSKREEISQIVPEVIRTVEAMYISGSNLVNSETSTIVDMATKAGVVTITHLEDLVVKGVLLGVCMDSYLMGRLAGEKAIKILKGAKPSSIPIETPKEYDLMINMKTAGAGQFHIPPEFKKKINREIQ